MLKTMENLKMILMMNKYHLFLRLLNQYKEAIIISCCERIEKQNVQYSQYKGHGAIQKELVENEGFVKYLNKMCLTNLDETTINAHLEVLHSKDDTAMNYPVERLISSMSYTVLYKEVFYDYLIYFSDLPIDKKSRQHTVSNLVRYRNISEKPVSELSVKERDLLTKPFLFYTSLIPEESVFEALHMLANHSGLLEIIKYLYNNELNVPLKIRHYESFCESPAYILNKFKEIYRLLGKNYYAMRNFLSLWLENNCSLFDLNILSCKLAFKSSEEQSDVFASRSSYINFIYGKKINNIPLMQISPYKEDILIYAITNKKKSFIKLVEDNYEAFSMVGISSILFERDFYAKFVNINSLNNKNLKDCIKMETEKMPFDSLKPGRQYTFEEIKALYGYPKQYAKLYNMLKQPRIDERIIILRQLTKRNLLLKITEDSHIERLAVKFNQKPFFSWSKQKFNHINGIKPNDTIQLLIHYSEIERFIPQMKTGIDARLVLRNRENIHDYDKISDMKNEMEKIDADWKVLVKAMDLNEQFLRQNQDKVVEFICRNGASIAKTYYNNLSNADKKEALKRILKALVMGEFYKLKYFSGDLQREIDYPIGKKTEEYWKENTELVNGNITIKECDDFFSTILMGTELQRTCLSYIDGAYKECLLSNFDSNKKILNAYENGKLVGRAIIRFTKGRYSDVKRSAGEKASLSFVDLEKLDEAKNVNDDTADKEYLVLFLERSYTAGINSKTAALVQNSFIELAEKKASQMGVMQVLSNSYDNCSLTDKFTRTSFYIYISKSKAGAQYLDSLNGSANISDEGGYRTNNFYINNNDINKSVT